MVNTRDQELGLLDIDVEPFTCHTRLPCPELVDTVLQGVCNKHQVISVEKLPRHTWTDAKAPPAQERKAVD